jgi:hypothetical protein
LKIVNAQRHRRLQGGAEHGTKTRLPWRRPIRIASGQHRDTPSRLACQECSEPIAARSSVYVSAPSYWVLVATKTPQLVTMAYRVSDADRAYARAIYPRVQDAMRAGVGHAESRCSAPAPER